MKWLLRKLRRKAPKNKIRITFRDDRVIQIHFPKYGPVEQQIHENLKHYYKFNQNYIFSGLWY